MKEQGLLCPTFRQAQTFADKTFIPFGYLFLSEPPRETLPIPDLRTVGDHPNSKNLAMAVASEALSGRMLLRDANHLIGVQPSKLKSFAKAIV